MADRAPNSTETAMLLEDAASQIENLQLANSLLSAQVRVIDVFEKALGRSGGGGELVGRDGRPPWMFRDAAKAIRDDQRAREEAEKLQAHPKSYAEAANMKDLQP